MTTSKKQQKDLEKLVSLGPERLAQMLIERAAWEDGTAHAVEQALAESDPVKSVVNNIKKGLGLYTNSRLAGAWHKSSVISRELDHLRVLIVESVLPKSPDAAAGLLEKLIDRHVPVFNNVDDSNGYLGDVFRQAVRDWGTAWAGISNRKVKHLAGMISGKIISNDYGMYDSIIPAFSKALAESGLAELERLVRKALTHVPPTQPDENISSISENWLRRGPLCHSLEEIADLRGDPDGYIEAVSLLGRPEVYAGDIAERLISAKRFEEALEWLARGGRLTHHNSAELKAKCLVFLGRKGEARELLWQDFLQTLSDAAYVGALKLAPEEEAEELRQVAIEAAKKHSSSLTAISFLLRQGFKPDAAALVVDRWQELNGDHYYTLRPAAEMLEIEFPLSAVLLRRRLIDAILEKANSKYYGYAVSDLRQAERISRMVKDWQGNDDHEHFLQQLRTRHGKKSSFWARLHDDKD